MAKNMAMTFSKMLEKEISDLKKNYIDKKFKNLVIDASQIAGGGSSGGSLPDGTIPFLRVNELIADVVKTTVAEIETTEIDTAEIDKLSARVADIVVATIQDLEIDWSTITSLTAMVTNIALANISTAVIGFAQIEGLSAGTALITELLGGKVAIADLAVTDANIVELNAGKITAGTISVERLVIVGSDKSIVFAINEVNGTSQLSQTTIDGGSITEKTITADQIIAQGITAECLNISQIFANEALIGAITSTNINVAELFAASSTFGVIKSNHIDVDELFGSLATFKIIKARNIDVEELVGDTAFISVIKAKNIDVDELFANSVFANALHTNIIQSDIGDNLNISSNQSVQLLASRYAGARNYVPKSDFSTDQTAHWAKWGDTYLVQPLTGSYARYMGFVIPANATSGERGIITPRMYGIFTRIGSEVTLSFKARRSLYGVNTLDYFRVLADDGNIVIPYTATPIDVNESETRHSVTFKNSTRAITTGIRILIAATQSTPGGSTMYISDVKLENGNVATDWRPANGEFYAGSSVTLTEDQIKLRSLTTSIEVPVGDTDESMLQVNGDGVTANAIAADTIAADIIDSPSVVSVYRGPYTLTVNKSATPNESTGVFRTIQAAIDSVSFKSHSRNVTINITSGQSFSEHVRLRETSGVGRVIIQTSSTAVATIRGSLKVEGCAGAMSVSNIAFRSTYTSGTSNLMLCVFRSNFAQIADCTFNGNSFTAYGILAEYGSTALVTGCSFYRCVYAMRAQPGCTISAYNTSGNNLTYSLYSYGAVIIASGTIPDAATYVARNGVLNVPSTTPTPGTTPAAPTDPEPTTVTYSCRLSSWYQTNAWSSETQIRQGYTVSGEFRGGLWFPTNIPSQLSGKTIESVQLRLRRKAGYGRSSAVDVVLGGLTNTGKSGAPAFVANYGKIGTISPNTTKTFDLHTSVITHLVNGSIGGLALYPNDGVLLPGREYSANYAAFFGTDGSSSTEPQLIVTYY